MYYPSSENEGADQLCGYLEADLRLCFCLCRLLVFSWGGSFCELIIGKTMQIYERSNIHVHINRISVVKGDNERLNKRLLELKLKRSDMEKKEKEITEPPKREFKKDHRLIPGEFNLLIACLSIEI